MRLPVNLNLDFKQATHEIVRNTVRVNDITPIHANFPSFVFINIICVIFINDKFIKIIGAFWIRPLSGATQYL